MAVGEAHVFPGFLTPVLTQISFKSHRLLFSRVSAEVRGEKTPERPLLERVRKVVGFVGKESKGFPFNFKMPKVAS